MEKIRELSDRTGSRLKGGGAQYLDGLRPRRGFPVHERTVRGVRDAPLRHGRV